MLPQTIQADQPRARDLIAQHAVGGERVIAGGMVRLIERELEKDRRAVERDVWVAAPRQIDHRNRAHPEIRLDAILDQPSRIHAHGDIVQEWVVERPATRIGQRDLEVGGARPARDVGRHGRLARPVVERDAEGERARRGFEQSGVNPYTIERAPRREMHRDKRRTAPRFQIDRLPDSPRGTVSLLAFELEWMRRVVNPQHQVMRPRFQLTRQLE